MAFFGRDPEDERAMAGALALADGLDCLRVVRSALTTPPKGGARG